MMSVIERIKHTKEEILDQKKGQQFRESIATFKPAKIIDNQCQRVFDRALGRGVQQLTYTYKCNGEYIELFTFNSLLLENPISIAHGTVKTNELTEIYIEQRFLTDTENERSERAYIGFMLHYFDRDTIMNMLEDVDIYNIKRVKDLQNIFGCNVYLVDEMTDKGEFRRFLS